MFESMKIGKKQPKEQPQTSETAPREVAAEDMSGKSEPPPPSSEQGLNTSSLGMNEPSHFDELISQSEAIEAEQERETVSASMLSQEQFRSSFVGLHGMASTATGLKSLALPNSHVSQDTAHEVADTIYETILDVPMLHFILQPGNKWFGRALVIGVYVHGMRCAVGAELRAKNPQESEILDFNKAKNAPRPEKGEPDQSQAAALAGGA